MDSKISELPTSNPKAKGADDIAEDRLREVVTHLAWKHRLEGLNEKSILYEIIKLIKCPLDRAREILRAMKDRGLELCEDHLCMKMDGSGSYYNLFRFARMWGYITDEELEKDPINQYHKQLDSKIQEMEKKYGVSYEELPDQAWKEVDEWEEEYWGTDEGE